MFVPRAARRIAQRPRPAEEQAVRGQRRQAGEPARLRATVATGRPGAGLVAQPTIAAMRSIDHHAAMLPIA